MAVVYTKVDQGLQITSGTGAPTHGATAGDRYTDTTSGNTYQYTTSWQLVLYNIGSVSINGNILYVSSVGSDTDTTRIGHIGDPSKPFLTIEAARNASISGDIIHVFPGTYTITTTDTNGILKDGVSYYFELGCIVNKTVTGPMIDGTGFILPIYVLGYGKFYGSVNCGYMITNTTSDSIIEGIVCSSTSSTVIFSTGTKNSIKFQTLFSSFGRTISYLGSYNTVIAELIRSTADAAIYRSGAYSNVICTEIITTSITSIQNDSAGYLRVTCNTVSGEIMAIANSLYDVNYCNKFSGGIGSGNMVFNGIAGSIVNAGQLNGVYYTSSYTSNSLYSNGCPIMTGNGSTVICSAGFVKAKIDVEATYNVSPVLTISGGVVVLEGNWNDSNAYGNSTISGGKLILTPNMNLELCARKDFISMSGGTVDLSNARINLKTSTDVLFQQYSVNSAIRWTAGTLISNGATITTASIENPPILADASGMNFKVLSGGFNTNYVNPLFSVLSAKKKKYKITVASAANTTVSLNDLSGVDENFIALVSGFPTRELLAQQLVVLINASGTLNITATQDTPGTDVYFYVESDIAGININLNNGSLVNVNWIVIRGNSFAINNPTGGFIIEDADIL